MPNTLTLPLLDEGRWTGTGAPSTEIGARIRIPSRPRCMIADAGLVEDYVVDSSESFVKNMFKTNWIPEAKAAGRTAPRLRSQS